MILTIIAILLIAACAALLLGMAFGWEPIEDWCVYLRRSATTWVTGAVNTIMAIIGVHWAVLLGVLPFVPLYWQLPLALLVAALTTAPTIIARLTKQPKLNAKIEEAKNGNA